MQYRFGLRGLACVPPKKKFQSPEKNLWCFVFVFFFLLGLIIWGAGVYKKYEKDFGEWAEMDPSVEISIGYSAILSIVSLILSFVGAISFKLA